MDDEPTVHPDKLERLAVERTRWDERDLDRLLKDLPEFAAEQMRLCANVATGGSAWADAYRLLNKGYPRMLAPGEMRPAYRVNHAVASELSGMKMLEELRSMGTPGDEVASALGLNSMRPDIQGLFDKLKAEQAKADRADAAQEELAQAEQEAGSLEEMLAGLDDMENASEAEARLEELQGQIPGLQESLAGAMEALEEALDLKQPLIKQALKDALEDALGDTAAVQGMAEAWGSDPGQPVRLNAAERIKLAKQLCDPRFREIAELFGRVDRVRLAEERQRVDHAREEIYEIGMGNDLARVLPNELLALEDPDLFLNFARRFVEGELMQYEMRGTEKLARGSIIYCDDGSGSMDGLRERWAKAIGIGLANQAKAQRRSFRGIHFGSAHEIACFDFEEPKDFTIDKIVDYASLFFDGGTDFQTPLTKALSYLQAEHAKNGAVRGDIVFATDGKCSVSPAWLKEFKAEQERLGFMVWGIAIGVHRDTQPLYDICDGRVSTVSDLTGGDDVREVFGGIRI